MTLRRRAREEVRLKKDSGGATNEGLIVKHVVMPLALASGIALATGVGVLTLSTGLAVWRGWSIKVPLAVTGAVSGVTFSGSALLLLLRYERLAFALERAMGRDLPFGPTHDGVVGDPERFSVEIKAGHRVSYINSASYQQWRAFVDRMVNGDANTSEAAWCGSRGPFEKGQWLDFRDELMRRGFAEWNNPDAHAQGWKLTNGGDALMRISAREMGLL